MSKEKLSVFILTFNSDKYLKKILLAIQSVANEIIILDSGSEDTTKEIANSFGCKLYYRKFDNFKNQRNYAISLCQNKMILFIDSDEIPDEQLISSINLLKIEGFSFDAYTLNREWIVLGKKISCIYPIVSPDTPIRLINKELIYFKEESNKVHETPTGYKTISHIDIGKLTHFTFETKEELERKLQLYTNIAAEDMLCKNKKITFSKLYVSPFAAWIKWYILKKGWHDGLIGWILGKYAFNYTYRKYRNLRRIKNEIRLA